jgi:hypothetical protein
LLATAQTWVDGSGGVGRIPVAARLQAECYADGVVFVDLSSVPPRADVTQAVAWINGPAPSWAHADDVGILAPTGSVPAARAAARSSPRPTPRSLKLQAEADRMSHRLRRRPRVVLVEDAEVVCGLGGVAAVGDLQFGEDRRDVVVGGLG